MSISGVPANNLESLSLGDVASAGVGTGTEGQHLSTSVWSMFTPGESHVSMKGNAAGILGDGFQLCMLQQAGGIRGNLDISSLPDEAQTYLSNDLHARSASINNGRVTLDFDQARDHNFPGAPPIHFAQTITGDMSLGENTVTLRNISGLSVDVPVTDPVFGYQIGTITPNLTAATFRRNGNNYTAEVTGSWFGISQTIPVQIDQSVYDQIRGVATANRNR